MNDFEIVSRRPELLTYVDSLQRKNAEQLSFYPKSVFERENERGRIFVGLLNGEPCGYIYCGATEGTMKCHQVCIQYDARRALYGALLVGHVENYAVKRLCSAVSLRCGFDLDANKFWSAIGYICVNVVQGGVRRGRKINVWRKTISQELFQFIECEPQSGVTSASAWAKGKITGKISSFSRGKANAIYRDMVIEKASETPATRTNGIILLDEVFGSVV